MQAPIMPSLAVLLPDCARLPDLRHVPGEKV
jgi:hypothetical protein